MVGPEVHWEQPEFHDGVDAYPDMQFRREINDYAEKRIDFNYEGMEAIKRHVELTPDDAILDIGCSSGRFMLEAAARANIPARLIGLDIVDYTDAAYAREGLDTSKFSFINASGENIPLSDNAVKAVTAHNVLFRSHDTGKMLSEFKRVTEPNGLIVISTNTKDHAALRHTIEKLASLQASMMLGVVSEPLDPPAEGFYLEDVPQLVERSGGLEIMEGPENEGSDNPNLQASEVKIFEGERLNTFMTSIEFSANYGDHPNPQYRDHYRVAVKTIISALVRDVFSSQRQYMAQQGLGKNFKPHLIDRVHRGMFVLRNIK